MMRYGYAAIRLISYLALFLVIIYCCLRMEVSRKLNNLDGINTIKASTFEYSVSNLKPDV